MVVLTRRHKTWLQRLKLLVLGSCSKSYLLLLGSCPKSSSHLLSPGLVSALICHMSRHTLLPISLTALFSHPSPTQISSVTESTPRGIERHTLLPMAQLAVLASSSDRPHNSAFTLWWKSCLVYLSTETHQQNGHIITHPPITTTCRGPMLAPPNQLIAAPRTLLEFPTSILPTTQ